MRYTIAAETSLIVVILAFVSVSGSFPSNVSTAITYHSGYVAQASPLFNQTLFGVGPEEWNDLGNLNSQYQTNMTLATSWICYRSDLYGWWSDSFSASTLWNLSYIPCVITWKYFTHSWGVDYSAYNLSLYRQSWIDDLTYMANRLKAPNDGKHTVLLCLETEFTTYENINYTYWNELMINSRNAIKEMAPNVLVSYSIGGWTWRWGDVAMKGELTSSMENMDFMSFQCMWGTDGPTQTQWMNGDDLKTDYQGINWTKEFGNKSHVWNFAIDDVIGNIKALTKYNKHVFLDYFCVDTHLWGVQSQVDAVNDISSNISYLRQLGLFGISWMNYKDKRWDDGTYWSGDIGSLTGGFEYPDGTAKPCLSQWASLIKANG